MAEVVVLGAGLSGTLMAYELSPQLRKEDRLTCRPGTGLSFRALQSLGRDRLAQAQRYRDRPGDIMKRKGIRLLTQGAQRVHPTDNRVELGDGTSIDYDYLVVATGPELAFDEIPGLGPGRPYAVDLSRRSRRERQGSVREARGQSGADRDRRGAGRVLLRPGLRIPVHPGHRAAAAQAARPRADDVRHLRALYRPSRARWRRRHQGPARKRDAREAHQVDHQCRASRMSNTGKMIGRGARRRRCGPQDARAAVRLFDDAAGVPRRRRRSRHREADQSAWLCHRRQAPAQSGISRTSSRSASASRSRRSAPRRFRSACRRPAS